MYNKEKLMVFPFDIQFSPVLRHRDLLDQQDIVSLVSPSGWGLNGKDAGMADSGNDLGIICNEDFEKQLELCDSVCFADHYQTLDFEKGIYPMIMKAIEVGKNIICIIHLEDRFEKEILKNCTDRGVYFKYYNEKKYFNPKLNSIGMEYQRIFDIHTPVVFVMGIAEKTHKFEIQLALRKSLMEAGYKVSQIGSRGYCEWLGFHSFPKFMYENMISETEKVVIFNHYIKTIEDKEKPDIIVIGVPGGTMPFDNIFTNRFGILAYEISQAITPDFAIVSTLYDDFNNEYFEGMSKSISYRFGFGVDCYNISNIQFDWQESRLHSRAANAMEYITYKSGFVDEKKKRYTTLPIPVYNILNPMDANDMCSYLINKLENYGEVESF